MENANGLTCKWTITKFTCDIYTEKADPLTPPLRGRLISEKTRQTNP